MVLVMSTRGVSQTQKGFLLRGIMAHGQVTPDDILEFGFDGEPLNENGRPVYLERFIHSEIYSARPDTMAVVHSRSHMAGFIGEEAPLFEMRDAGGPATDLLISNAKLGKALARCCGDHNIALMRGHGSTVIADSLRLAVFRAVYAEVNARYQCDAARFGEVVYLSKRKVDGSINSAFRAGMSG